MERRTFLKKLLFSSGALLVGSDHLFASTTHDQTLKLLMIYNNIGEMDGYVNQWGLSLWIENKKTAVIFDTGGDSSTLWSNIENSGVDIRKLSKIVISHNHWDHTGGLPFILEKTNYKPEVLIPEFDLEEIRSNNPKAKCTGIKSPRRINETLWSTGQLKGSTSNGIIHEQSLIITHNDSILLFTGCSHPGIVDIVEKTKKIHPNKKIDLVGGGFHLLQSSEEVIQNYSDKLKILQVKRLAPSHCTGTLALDIFKDQWGEKFIDLNNGNIMFL